MDSTSNSREREAGGKEERGRGESSTEGGRKASERGGSRAGRKENAASSAQQQGDGRQGNSWPNETLKRYYSPAPQENTAASDGGPSH